MTIRSELRALPAERLAVAKALWLRPDTTRADVLRALGLGHLRPRELSRYRDWLGWPPKPPMHRVWVPPARLAAGKEAYYSNATMTEVARALGVRTRYDAYYVVEREGWLRRSTGRGRPSRWRTEVRRALEEIRSGRPIEEVVPHEAPYRLRVPAESQPPVGRGQLHGCCPGCGTRVSPEFGALQGGELYHLGCRTEVELTEAAYACTLGYQAARNAMLRGELEGRRNEDGRWVVTRASLVRHPRFDPSREGMKERAA